MKRSLLAVALSCVALSTTAFVLPETDAVTVRYDDTELSAHMKSINKSMRKLRAMLKSESKAAEALETVLSMQEHALAAKGLDPMKAGDYEGDEDRAAFILKYRKGMHDFLNQMFDLETALLEGDMKAAMEVHRALCKTKSPSHKQFKARKKKAGRKNAGSRPTSKKSDW